MGKDSVRRSNKRVRKDPVLASTRLSTLVRQGSGWRHFSGSPATYTSTFPAEQITVDTPTLWGSLQRAKFKTPGLYQKYLKGLDAGGLFFSERRRIVSGVSPQRFYRITGNNQFVFEGTLTAFPLSGVPIDAIPGTLPIGESLDMLGAGSTAIARCAPAQPVASLANFLGELKRDGLPSLPGAELRDHVQKGQALKGSGSEFLNWQFATQPFLSDLRDFANTMRKTDSLLAQYARDSGKQIRRRYEFPEEKGTSVQVVSENYYPPNTGSTYLQRGGRLTKTTTVVRKTWFSGAFTYFLPKVESGIAQIQNYIRRADMLYGVKPDPEVLWNLSPWSWAVDWFSNFGDVFKNISMFAGDGLVLKYGYIMRETRTTVTYSLTGCIPHTDTIGFSDPPDLVIEHVRKARLKATPFGFGVDIGALSARQHAIIAALGLTQGSRIAK